MSIELLKSISTQKAHKTCYKQGSILHYLGTNQRRNGLVAPSSFPPVPSPPNPGNPRVRH